jgi:hypothetical protein
MTQFPSNSGQVNDSQAPRIEVAEGVIRFKPDFTEVYAELDALDRRLDTMEDRIKSFSVSQSVGGEPSTSGASTGTAPPLLSDEEDAVAREEALTLLRSIENKLEEMLNQQAGV